MAISMFDSRAMIPALDLIHPPKSFLRDMFFRTSNISIKETVDIDIRTGGRQLAPFTSLQLPAYTKEKKGWITKSYNPPPINSKAIFTSYDVLKRDFGSHIYENLMTPEQRAASELGRELQEFVDDITRREEWMAAKLIDTGTYTATGEGVSLVVDFGYVSSHRYTASTLWSAGGAKPLADIKTACELIEVDGAVKPDTLILGISTVEYFVELVKKTSLDLRERDLGRILIDQLPNGANYLGRLSEYGLNVYSYASYYDDGTGTIVNMVPADRIYLGSTEAYCSCNYGAIPDLQNNVLASVKYYPKTWMSNDPSAMYLQVQSRPLVAMHQPQAFASIEVV